LVWSHNTTTSRATNFTPFKLLYGSGHTRRSHVGVIENRPRVTNEEDTNLAIDTREEDKLQVLSNIEKIPR
jgi:hypothetical protein